MLRSDRIFTMCIYGSCDAIESNCMDCKFLNWCPDCVVASWTLIFFLQIISYLLWPADALNGVPSNFFCKMLNEFDTQRMASNERWVNESDHRSKCPGIHPYFTLMALILPLYEAQVEKEQNILAIKCVRWRRMFHSFSMRALPALYMSEPLDICGLFSKVESTSFLLNLLRSR